MNIQHIANDLEESKVINRNFSGDVYLNDILSSWKKLLEDNLINDKTEGVLNNLCKCNLCMKKEDFMQLLAYLKSVPEIKKLKLAVVCENPITIVFPMMAEQKETDLKIKAFTTIDAATNWIVEI